MRLVLTAALVSIAITGCAKRPDAITPVSIPMAAYTNLSCPQLAQEMTAERTRLTALSESQNSAATGDAFGVFLIGVPTSSLLGGNKEGDVAVSKGKVQAMESAALSKRCVMPAT